MIGTALKFGVEKGAEMNINQIEEYLKPYGMQMYEVRAENDKRRRYYRLVFPVFVDDEEIPSSNNHIFEKSASDIYKRAKEMLDDKEYKEKCEFWINNY